jgi:hypothetical protein
MNITSNVINVILCIVLIVFLIVFYTIGFSLDSPKLSKILSILEKINNHYDNNNY